MERNRNTNNRELTLNDVVGVTGECWLCSCGEPIRDGHCQKCGYWHDNWGFDENFNRTPITKSSSMRLDEVLMRTYKWLLSQYGTRSNIRIDTSRGDRVQIFVAISPKGGPYFDGTMESFLNWFDTNVD